MIDVIRLPNELNISERIRKKMLEVYGTCPYCLNDNLEEYADWRYGIGTYTVTYKTLPCGFKSIGNGLFRKSYKWKRYVFTCNKCGMVWASPEFPIIGNDVKLNNAIFRSWKNKKMDMEVKTLLLGVMDGGKN